MGNNPTNQHSKFELDPDFLERVVDAHFTLKGTKNIAAEFGITPTRLSQLRRRPEFQELMRSELKIKVSRLYQTAVTALEKALKDGNMEAVKVVFKSAGVLDAVENKGGDTAITVIMPSGIPEQKVIEVQGEDITERVEAD